jgi:hypothetical protein
MHDSYSQPSISSRYVFRITRNGTCVGRSDGLAFADKAAACREAFTTCGEIIREMDGAIEPNSHWRMEVSDHSGRLIYRFTFTAEEV